MSGSPHHLFRLTLALLALAAAAPSQASEVIDLDPHAPAYRDIVAAAERAMANELVQPVTLDVTMLRADDSFAGLAGRLARPDGGPLDFSITPYAADVESGFFDGPHLWAFLGFSEGKWQILKYDIGPTDAWFMSWPAEYDAECTLMGAGIGTC